MGKKTIKFMAFMTCWFQCMMYVHFNIYVPLIANPSRTLYFDWNTSDCGYVERRIMDYEGPTFQWSQLVQCSVLGAHGVGNFISELGSVFVVDAMGPRWTVFACTLLSSACTALIVLAANLHWGAVFIVRVIVGVAGGIVTDAILILILRWVPDTDKINFSHIVKGGVFLGVAFTWILCGVLVLFIYWPINLYILAAIECVWSIVWAMKVRDAPTDDSRITLAKIHQENIDLYKGGGLPFAEVLKSSEYISLILLHYADMCGLTVFLALMPKYIYDIERVHLITAGGFCALALVLRFGSGILLQYVVAQIIKHECLSVTATRKFFVFFSHIFTGLSMLALGYTGCVSEYALPILCFAGFMSGASSVTNLANAKDLSPRYFRILFLFMHFIGLTASFLIPHFAGVIIGEQLSMVGWRYFFIFIASIYIFFGIAFLVFGSGAVMPWNFPFLTASESPRASETEKKQRNSATEPHKSFHKSTAVPLI